MFALHQYALLVYLAKTVLSCCPENVSSLGSSQKSFLHERKREREREELTRTVSLVLLLEQAGDVNRRILLPAVPWY